MRIYSYVVEHDLGFAPNPFFGVCTLAACKPRIRKYAKTGDYVVGTGAAKPKLRGHLVYWMRVGEIVAFDEYWRDKRFHRKRPFVDGSLIQRYGDNIYHLKPGSAEYLQEDSFHSEPDGCLSVENRHRDTGVTSHVLIATKYAYWGGSGPKIPSQFQDFVVQRTGHKCRFEEQRAIAFVRWLEAMPERGYQAEPAHWQFLK